MSENLLVTGGAGFIGSHFARVAHEAGHRVIVLDENRPLMGADIPSVVADISDRRTVVNYLHRHHITAVVHFAGVSCVGESVVNPQLYFDVNVARTLALLDAVLTSHVRTFVYSSSAAVYGAPTTAPIPETAPCAPMNPYGATKLAIEHVLAAYGVANDLRWAALRYFNAAGAHPDGSLRENHDPETHLIPKVVDASMRRRGPITVFGNDYPTPDGTCVRDYVHVMDLAQAHLAALEALGRGVAVGAANLASSTGYSVREVIDTASRVVGRPGDDHRRHPCGRGDRLARNA